MFVKLLPLLILLLFRFYDLGIRPPHHDESVNGWFVDGLINRGYYVYDPANYHGPLFFYVLALFEQCFGRSVEALRASTVIFGSLLALSPLLFRKWLGMSGTLIAIAVLTFSPALIFYSRYAIHETPFALACVVFFYFWLEIRERGWTLKNKVGLGLSLGAMACLKENFVLFGAALGLAEASLWALKRKAPLRFDRSFWRGITLSFGIAILLIVIFFTGFFQDSNGIGNFFKAFALWFQTGEKGNGHEKPFYYWLKLMGQFEWFALFGLALVPFSLASKTKEAVKLCALTGLFLILIYSAVAYKTPWCMLCFYWSFILIASERAGHWYDQGHKFLVALGLVGVLSYSAYSAYDAAYAHPDQENHPYIYGQTFHDMMGPLNQLVARGKENPSVQSDLKIQVISSFTWPLPYVLGEFKQAAYYGEANAPAVLDADEVIMDQAFEAKLGPRLKGHYLREETRSRQWAGPILFFHLQK